MITGLVEEAEAIGTQRKNSNFRTDLQFLLRRKKEWRKVSCLTDGNIMEAAEKAD